MSRPPGIETPNDPPEAQGNAGPAPWTIWTGCSITRRKTYHLVTDPSGEVRFRHRLIWPCVEWLDAEGVETYLLKPSDPASRPTVRFLHATKGI